MIVHASQEGAPSEAAAALEPRATHVAPPLAPHDRLGIPSRLHGRDALRAAMGGPRSLSQACRLGPSHSKPQLPARPPLATHQLPAPAGLLILGSRLLPAGRLLACSRCLAGLLPPAHLLCQLRRQDLQVPLRGGRGAAAAAGAGVGSRSTGGAAAAAVPRAAPRQAISARKGPSTQRLVRLPATRPHPTWVISVLRPRSLTTACRAASSELVTSSRSRRAVASAWVYSLAGGAAGRHARTSARLSGELRKQHPALPLDAAAAAQAPHAPHPLHTGSQPAAADPRTHTPLSKNITPKLTHSCSCSFCFWAAVQASSAASSACSAFSTARHCCSSARPLAEPCAACTAHTSGTRWVGRARRWEHCRPSHCNTRLPLTTAKHVPPTQPSPAQGPAQRATCLPGAPAARAAVHRHRARHLPQVLEQQGWHGGVPRQLLLLPRLDLRQPPAEGCGECSVYNRVV